MRPYVPLGAIRTDDDNDEEEEEEEEEEEKEKEEEEEKEGRRRRRCLYGRDPTAEKSDDGSILSSNRQNYSLICSTMNGQTKTHISMKRCTPRLVLKKEVTATRKWLILTIWLENNCHVDQFN